MIDLAAFDRGSTQEGHIPAPKLNQTAAVGNALSNGVSMLLQDLDLRICEVVFFEIRDVLEKFQSSLWGKDQEPVT